MLCYVMSGYVVCVCYVCVYVCVYVCMYGMYVMYVLYVFVCMYGMDARIYGMNACFCN